MDENEQTDVTHIEFSMPLNYQGVCNLMEYLVVNLEYPVCIDLYSERKTEFGRRHLPKPECIDDVVVNDRNGNIKGLVLRSDSSVESARFNLEVSYLTDSEFYTSLHFETTPGYEPGELESDSLKIMKDMHEISWAYFKELQIVKTKN
jgi:hypothetical protein